MWAGRSPSSSSQFPSQTRTRTRSVRTSIRAHSVPSKKSYSMLTVLVLFCCTFLVVVDIELVASMSLDRLGIDRSNEIQSDKKTDVNEERISDLVVEDEELQAVPVSSGVGGGGNGETAMYVLLPAGGASERESVDKNTIESSDEVESPNMSENASDMVMMETNEAPLAVQIVNLPPSKSQEVEKEKETEAINSPEINETPKEETLKPATSEDEHEDEPIKQVFKNDKDIEDMAFENESDKEKESGEDSFIATETDDQEKDDSDEEPETVVEMFADVVGEVEKEIETELMGEETETSDEKVVSPVDTELAKWEATVEKLAEKGSEKEKDNEENNDIELEAAAVLEDILPVDIVEAMAIAEESENSSEEKTENEEFNVKEENVNSSPVAESETVANVEEKPAEKIPELPLEDTKPSTEENVEENKTEEKLEEPHDKENEEAPVEETKLEETPIKENDEESKVEQQIPEINTEEVVLKPEEDSNEAETKPQEEIQIVPEIIKPAETVSSEQTEAETEVEQTENIEPPSEIKPVENEIQSAQPESQALTQNTPQAEEEKVEEPASVIQEEEVEINKDNELPETNEEPLKLETIEKAEETETEMQATAVDKLEQQDTIVESAVEAEAETETVKEEDEEKKSNEESQHASEVSETAPKVEVLDELAVQPEGEEEKEHAVEQENTIAEEQPLPIETKPETDENQETQQTEEKLTLEVTIPEKVETESQPNPQESIDSNELIMENEHKNDEKLDEPAEVIKKPVETELSSEQDQHEVTPQKTEEQEASKTTENADEPTILTTIIQMPAQQQQQQQQMLEGEEAVTVSQETHQSQHNEMHAPNSHVQNEQIPVGEPVASTQVTIESTTQRPQIVAVTAAAIAAQDSVLNYVNATNAMAASNVEKEQQKQQQQQEQLQQSTESGFNNETTFNSQLRRYDGAQVWRIVVQSDRDRRMADELQTKYDGQLWKEVKQEVDYLLKPQVLPDAEKHIRAANLSRIVLIDNLQKVIEVENPMLDEIADADNEKGHRLTWQAYHRLADIHDFFDYLAKTYPEICAVETIGYSIQKRPLKVLKISNGNAGNPGVWIDGGMHAREWISPASVTYIANQLAEGWEDLPSYMQNINWYIHAVANPDGYEYSHTTDRLWRKNLRSHGRQCPGVDLNRNFGYKWGGKGTSANPCSQNYRGSKAFSEPETFYISKFISGFPRDTFQAFLSFHSYGQYILYPWGFDYMLTYDRSDLDRVARAAATTITRSTGMKYTVGPSAVTLYPAAGGSDDWAKGIAQIKYAYTIEMGDTGRYGFILPSSHIEPNGKDAYTFVQTVARAISHDVRKRTIKLKK